jgi:hypothetical protein
MAGRDLKETRLAGIRVQSWLWLSIVCVLLGTVWLVRQRDDTSLAPTVAMNGKVAEPIGEIEVDKQAGAGAVRRWTHRIGVIAAFTAAIFIYSAAR